MARVAVTGGYGFLGSHVTQELARRGVPAECVAAAIAL